MLVESLVTPISESWFIPTDIIMIICTLTVIVLSAVFLLIIIFDKTCHTVPMLLVFNSCLSAFVNGCVLSSMALFTFHNDLKQTEDIDLLCNTRAYIVYGVYSLLNYSFFIEALYRYITVVYPAHLFFRTFQFQICLICLTWLFCFLYPIGFVLTDGFHYNVDNQICFLIFKLSFSIIYGAFCAYTIPLLIIMFIYIKLVRYVRRMSQRVTSVYTLNRAKRELKMVQRTIILISILIALGLPFLIFFLISFFTNPPKYHLRIMLLFIDMSMTLVIIAELKFTEPLKTSLRKIIHRQRNVVAVITR